MPSSQFQRTAINGDYTVLLDDVYIGVLAKSGPNTITLPSIESLPPNQSFFIKDEAGEAGTFSITIAAQAGQEIQGSGTFAINVNYGSVEVFHNGIAWVVLASNDPTVTPISAGGTGGVTAAEAVENLGIDIRDPVRVASKANVDLLSPPTVVNGVTLSDGDSVLLWLQTSAIDNGVYNVVDASEGTWERRADFDESSDFRLGVQVLSLEGNSFAGVYFVVNTANPVIGTDPISITPLSGAGAVYDPYGNKVFGYDYQVDDVNYLRAEGTPLGNNARLRAWSDTETHVGGSLDTKGNGRWTGLQLIEINDTTDIDTAGDASYNVYAVCGSLITRDPNGADRSDTLPTAAEIIAHIPNCFARQSFRLTIVNRADAAESITLVANTGITLSGVGPIQQGETKQFLFYINDTAAMGSSDEIFVYELSGSTGGGGGGPTIGNGLVESMGTLSVDIGPEFQFFGSTIYAKSIGANRLQEYVVNQTGSNLPSGTAVAMRPNADGSQGVVRADSMTNIFATHVVAGVDIADGSPGYITKAVIFGSLDTSSAAGDGSPIYLDMNGGYIYDNPPSGANTLAQVLGYVGNKDATTGTILFAPQIPTRYGTAFLQNGAVTAAKISASFSIDYASEVVTTPTQRLYIGGGSGSDPVVGATLLQATTGATATVSFLNDNDSMDVTSITGTFNTSDVVTGTNPDTSTFTFTPTMTVVDCWEISNQAAAFTSVTSNDGTVLSKSAGALLLSAGKVRFQPSIGITQGQVETLQSDGWTSLYVEYARSEVVVA